jgi:hypothetical protein
LIKKLFLYAVFILIAERAFAQQDSIHKKKLTITTESDSLRLLSGNRISEKEDFDGAKLIFGGYVSAYYAHYTDETNNGGFVQFPTMAARNNQFALNLAQLSMQYRSKNVRGNITMHYGDLPASVWSTDYNLIQEANVGFKIVKKLWLDAGFFKTHIGVESIQPRENITSSMSVVNFYDPYYLSGAKLTYEVNGRLSVQVNAFNTYNGFVETNKKKAIGASVLYDLNKHVSFSYNFLSNDDTPDDVKTKHMRYLHNLYATIKTAKWSVGIDANFATQQNSVTQPLKDSSKTAITYGGLIVAKYHIIKTFGIYGRVEYFSDPNNVFTGQTMTGNYITGGTVGFEYTPHKNVSFSVEGRELQSDNLIFKENGYMTNQRYEFIACLDIWF